MTLLEVIALTYGYYRPGQTLQDAVLKMYAGDLADLDERKCIEAYHKWRRNPQNKTFPLPAQIRELVAPEQFVSVEAQAREIAKRICGAITKFGWNNGKSAQVYIGPEGWSAVQRCGGWSYLCENHGRFLNPTTFEAQVRDLLEGQLKYGMPVMEEKIQALSEAKSRGLEPIGDVLKQLTQGKDPDDGGAA